MGTIGIPDTASALFIASLKAESYSLRHELRFKNVTGFSE
jgi:hypothetical protein